MSLCSCNFYDDDDDEDATYWAKKGDVKPFDLARRKRCVSCRVLINKDEECQPIENWCVDADGKDVYLADTYLCEKCSDLSQSVEELRGCYTLGDLSIKEQITESLL